MTEDSIMTLPKKCNYRMEGWTVSWSEGRDTEEGEGSFLREEEKGQDRGPTNLNGTGRVGRERSKVKIM